MCNCGGAAKAEELRLRRVREVHTVVPRVEAPGGPQTGQRAPGYPSEPTPKPKQ